ncbi:2-dehydropantoate 2-reductase [Paenibacillus phyllosphaerae]|uniref:2-dehydropantoate 2-reductase n=1 Tax=Paenibacillus phyllosphaerae TaxID=274593 RepID=A0A7W5AUR7_9BACL|nr:2-dehydropantoate 2-reductase [Paenibacillus phyllosphaerae]MBB3109042.1 2-dehydropantoate 2-reductase [Paenibacillus phyllosphaerae]
MGRIYIVGAGALGLMYGLRLASAGVLVTLVTRTSAQAELLRAQGGRLEQQGQWRHMPVSAYSIDELAELDKHDLPLREDWVWYTVKQPQMTRELLAQTDKLVASKPSILCLQNGIGHLELFEALYPELHVYAGVTTEGAMRTSLTEVRHTGEGSLVFGAIESEREPDPEGDEAQKMLLHLLRMAGIAASLSNEMRNRIYEKLLINAVINPLTAIFGVSNGELPAHPHRRKMMRALHQESERLLRQAGLAPLPEAWERLLAVCEATAANESSMLRDVRAGRGTEIDWINGGISALAKRMGHAAPLNDAVTAMVKALH